MHDPTRYAKGFVQDDTGLVHVRPMPWQEGDSEFNTAGRTGTVSVTGISSVGTIPTPALSIPTNQAQFDAVIAQVYADMNLVVGEINSTIVALNAEIGSLVSQINAILS